MKRISKFYSPFFLLLIAVLHLSCTDKHKSNRLNTINDSVYKKLKAEQLLADEYYNKEDYYNAYKLYLDLKEKWQDLNDNEHMGYMCLKMAEICYKKGNYTEGETVAVEALDYLKKTGNIENLPTVYNLLGVIYRKLYNYESALSSYKDVTTYLNGRDSISYYIVKNNIASVYIDSKQYSKALNILLPINKSNIVAGIPETKARVLDNIGLTYLKLNEPATALQFLERGLKIRQSILDTKGLTSSYFNLYDFYTGSNINTAKKYALAAYETSKKRGHKEDRLKALKALLHTNKGQEHNNYLSEYITLNDSLNIAKIKDENKFAKIKYDYKNEQSRRLKLETQQAKNALKTQQDKFVIWVLTGITILIITIFVFIYKTQQLKHKKDKVIEVYNTESRISKKIHDELANDVFKVMSFAENDNMQYAGQQKLLQDLEAIYNKTRDISHENNTIDTGEKFGEVLRQMLADYKTANVNVLSTNFDMINWNKIAAHKKIAVYRVLHELMVNMKKHSGAKLVVIKFNIKNNNVVIDYTDNGCGIQADKLILKNGLQNAENRITAINGSLKFESSNSGLKVHCTFPV